MKKLHNVRCLFVGRVSWLYFSESLHHLWDPIPPLSQKHQPFNALLQAIVMNLFQNLLAHRSGCLSWLRHKRQPRGGHVGCFRPPPTVLSTLEGRWIRLGKRCICQLLQLLWLYFDCFGRPCLEHFDGHDLFQRSDLSWCDATSW